MTLPQAICEQLGVAAGDRLELEVEGGVLVARPSKRAALDALQQIQAAFAASGLSEPELQATGRKVRRQLSAERYGRTA